MRAEDRLDHVAQHLRSRVSVTGRPVERSTLDELMAELNVPAVSVTVLDEDGTIGARAWGATPETLFQAASISKPVTAIATFALAAGGLFDLDQEANELLRTWKLPDGDGVTVRRILSHSAGLSVHGFPGYARSTPLPSVVQILDGVEPANTEAVRVVRPPGEAYQYSGGGFTLLQVLLEDVTGEPFAQLMRRVVLDPLAMNASTYEQPLPDRLHAQAATGHDEKGTPLEGGWVVHPERAAAGLWTNPAELVRVAAEMLRPGCVLDTAQRDEMLVPQTDEHFGLGWALEGQWFQHGGSNVGFRALFFASVTHQRAAVAMTNSDGGGSVCADVMATIAEAFGWPGYLKERTAIQLDDATLDAIAGVYVIEQIGIELLIRREGHTLMSSIPGFLTDRELLASSPTTFFRIDVDYEISWAGDELVLTSAGTMLTARRKDGASH